MNVFTSIVYILLAPYLAEQSKISIFPGFVFDPQKFLVFLSSIIYIGRSTTNDRVFKHDENNGVSNMKKKDAIDELHSTGELCQIVQLGPGYSFHQSVAIESVLISSLINKSNLLNAIHGTGQPILTSQSEQEELAAFI
ncbi:hypothetical protein TYRP_018511, partial [Tyrophagus putrescentiae]